MFRFRAVAATFLLGLLNLNFTTCRSANKGEEGPAAAEDPVVELPGVETSMLTEREKRDWSDFVSDLLAPCENVPVSLSQCVKEARDCKFCVPAAQYIVKQVQQGRSRSQVEAAFKARFSPAAVTPIEVQDSPIKGDPDAPVTMVEFADFQCPACASAKPLLDTLVEQHAGTVRLVFKHFPLGMHQYAEHAARAAVAAHMQGKFWPMQAALFENQMMLSEATIENLAKESGLDLARFKKDVTSEGVADVVNRDRKQGEAAQISSTPTLFINGRKFPPSPDFEQDLREWIELEIELAGRTPGSQNTAPKKPTEPAAPAPPPQNTAPKKPTEPAAPAPAPEGAPKEEKAPSGSAP